MVITLAITSHKHCITIWPLLSAFSGRNWLLMEKASIPQMVYNQILPDLAQCLCGSSSSSFMYFVYGLSANHPTHTSAVSKYGIKLSTCNRPREIDARSHATIASLKQEKKLVYGRRISQVMTDHNRHPASKAVRAEITSQSYRACRQIEFRGQCNGAVTELQPYQPLVSPASFCWSDDGFQSRRRLSSPPSDLSTPRGKLARGGLSRF